MSSDRLLELTKYYLTINHPGVAVLSAPFAGSANLNSLISNIFLLQGFTDHELSWNYPSWSVSVEFFTYFVFGAIAFISIERSGAILYLALLTTSIALVLLLTCVGNNEATFPVSFLRCVYSFFIGVITFNIHEKTDISSMFSTSMPALFLLFLCYMVILSVDPWRSVDTLMLPFLFAVAILAIVKTNDHTMINKFLNLSIFTWLGSMSYGIYMTHVLVWRQLVRIQRFVLGYDFEFSGGSIKILHSSPIVSDVVVLVGISLVLIISYLSYHYLEAPFKMIGKRL